MTDLTDLADFLLAHIDEDEAALRAWQERERYGPIVAFRGEQLTARLLAECDAKRQHVDHYLIWATPDEAGHLRNDTWAEATRFELSLVLLGMARVYSHHPDYQQEWRP